MPDFAEWAGDWPPVVRIAAILTLAIFVHYVVRLIRRVSERLFAHEPMNRRDLWRNYPRFATLTTIIVSALTFTIYFAAIGFVLSELGVDLTAYIASASVIGLAVGFGSQGFVQDVVVGLTLIFSDVLNVGDVVDISGQTGRVQRIGLRFTTMVNLFDQRVSIPNRNIALISKYRKGYVRAYADVQIPEGGDAGHVKDVLEPIAAGMRQQFRSIILTDPEFMGIREAESGGWSYIRIKFRIWPGQGALVETGFKPRVLTALKKEYPEYADWMVAVTYRAG